MAVSVLKDLLICRVPLQLPIPCRSLQIAITDRLLAFLRTWRAPQKALRTEKISFYYLSPSWGYRSAIALQLAKGDVSISLSVASQIVANLKANNPVDRPCLELTMQVSEAGWIDFQLEDRALGTWLLNLPPFLTTKKQINLPKSASKLLTCQYAHARCCSLLRSGDREGLIKLKDSQMRLPIWQWQAPEPIPWFDAGSLRLVSQGDRDLLRQILIVSDVLANKPRKNWYEIINRLSEAVLAFDRYCRIWGEVKRDNLALSQARLGLVAIAQALLRQLLEEKMTLWAPTEL
jgi:hypothetical protein